MNGDTRNKLKGSLWGAVITAILTFVAFIYGYGVLNQRVEALEVKVGYIQEINNRLTVIETDVKWIRSNYEGKWRIK